MYGGNTADVDDRWQPSRLDKYELRRPE